MAAAGSSTEDELSCPICFELFVDPHTPKNLPSCGHVLCEVCLKQMVAGQRTCPECRQEIKIPRDGIASFTTNYRLRNLAENYQKVEDNPPQQRESPKKARVPLCPDHEDEKMHCYCITCNTLACRVCLVLKHNGAEHKLGDIKDIYRKQKVELQSAVIKAKSEINKEESTLSEITTTEIQSTEIYRNVTKVSKNVKKQIENRTRDYINQLKTDSQKLIERVEHAEQMHIAELKKIKGEPSNIQKHIDSANAAYQAAVSASENLPDYEYITQHGRLINKMEETEISKQLGSKTKQDVIKFVPNSSHIKLGHIIAFTPEKIRTVKRIQTLEGFNDACRLDCSPDGLLAITDYDEKDVVIYHQVNGKYERKMDIKFTPDSRYRSQGVASSPDGRFVVTRVTCIKVFSPDGNYLNNIRLKRSGEVGAHRVQVLSDGRILVADYFRSLIMEIDPTGYVIRYIHTSVKPTHMILMHDTHIAISDNDAGRVVMIDIKSGEETLCIDIAEVQGICYDEHTECLLTARSQPAALGMIYLNKGVIEQYSCTTGKLIACLQQGLYQPKGMALTSEGHLIVANCKTVEIYKIQ